MEMIKPATHGIWPTRTPLGSNVTRLLPRWLRATVIVNMTSVDETDRPDPLGAA